MLLNVEGVIPAKRACCSILFSLITEHMVLMWPEAVAVSEISLFPKHHVSGGYRIGVIPIPS